MTTPWWRTKYPEKLWPVFEDFKVFLAIAWKHLNLPRPTPVQLDIADYLQHGPARSIVQAFRGVGKSWITGAFSCWLLLRNRQTKIMVVSASKERADNFSTFVLQLLHPESGLAILKDLFPEPHQRQSKISFDVKGATPDQAPSVRSIGVMGQMTGGRADYIIPDDVEVPNNSDTVGMREKLAERVKEFDAIIKPGGRITFLGTPQTEESLYNKLLERGYSRKIWPARVPDPAKLAGYGADLADLAHHGTPGSPVDPKRFDKEDLWKRELSYGSAGFALQFMLDTRLSDQEKYPLKLGDLVVMDLDPDLAPEKVLWSGSPDYKIENLPLVGFSGDHYHKPFEYVRDSVSGTILMREYTGALMSIDPSGRGKDETGYAITKVLNSQIFLHDAGNIPGGYEDAALERIARLAQKHKVKKILIESNFGDGMFEKLLQPVLARIYPCMTEEVRSSQQKEKRIIDTLEPVLAGHRLIVDRSLIQRDYDSVSGYSMDTQNQYRLFYQLTHISRDRGSLVRDDRVDALAMNVAYWVDAMGLDADQEIAKEQERWAEERLERFMDRAERLGLGGSEKGGPNWLNV